MNYWRTTGPSKEFFCPFDLILFRQHVPLNAQVLDYGTGYGRLLGLLAEAGYSDLTGVDASPEMTAQAQARVPSAPVQRVKPSEVPFEDESFDAVVLYSVLSSLLTLTEQQYLINELHRVLRPGGVLYLNDFAVQFALHDKPRYQTGYRLGRQQYGDTVFVDPIRGYTFYHFGAERLGQLFGNFSVLQASAEPARSMNGSLRSAFQLLLCRGGVPFRLPPGIVKHLAGGERVDQPA